MTVRKIFPHANGKNRPHCRLCGYGSRGTVYDYQVIRHIARVHGMQLDEAEEWKILDKQQEGDDSRCFYHLHATTGAVPLADHVRRLFCRMPVRSSNYLK